MGKRKTIIVFLVIFVLLFIIGGLFLLLDWIKFKEAKGPDLSYENEYVKAEDFEIIEEPEGRFVRCGKYSLKIKVPEEWSVKIYNGGVDLNDPNTDENNLLDSARQGACGMGVAIHKNRKNNPQSITEADYLKKEIKYLEKEGAQEDSESREEVILLNGNKGLKKTLFHKGEISFINIEMPIDQTIYSFTSGFIGAEKCVESFNSIMETVEVNR